MENDQISMDLPDINRPATPGKLWTQQNQIFYDKWVNFASSPGGDALVFGWAVAEATFWPVIPDFVLAPLAVTDRRKPYRSWLASSLGSALGSLLLFGLTRRFPKGIRRLIARLPLVHTYYFGQVHQKLVKNRFLTLFLQPWSGVPAKVVVVVGAEKSHFSWSALPVLMLSRAFRMGLVVLVTHFFARLLKRHLPKFSLLVIFLYLLFFIPIWWQIVRNRSKK